MVKELNITTLARRITRAINKESNFFTVIFDAEGNVIETHEFDMYYPVNDENGETLWLNSLSKDHKYSFRGRSENHATYAEIQEKLYWELH